MNNTWWVGNRRPTTLSAITSAPFRHGYAPRVLKFHRDAEDLRPLPLGVAVFVVIPHDLDERCFVRRGAGVELRKSRRLLNMGIFLLVGGALLLLCGRTDGLARLIGVLILGGFGILTGGALVVAALKPFRFHIGTEGFQLLPVRSSLALGSGTGV
ncbi:MAG TPA: hypothetical protein VFX60_17955 [Micromonospora sp.]|nr:hypothetical protein [Micromonospora sp.]